MKQRGNRLRISERRECNSGRENIRERQKVKEIQERMRFIERNGGLIYKNKS